MVHLAGGKKKRNSKLDSMAAWRKKNSKTLQLEPFDLILPVMSLR